jgi:hypothetical protein
LGGATIKSWWTNKQSMEPDEARRERKRLSELEGKINDYGEARLRLVSEYYDRQQEFFDEIEENKEKAKRLLNADIVKKKKFALKQQRLGKRVQKAFKEMNDAYLRGEIQDKEGKIIAKAFEKLTHGHIEESRELLEELRGDIDLYEEYTGLREQMERELRDARKQKTAIEHALRDAREVEQDPQHAEKHERVKELLLQISSVRARYCEKIKEKSVAELVNLNKDLVAAGFPSPDDASALDELVAFLAQQGLGSIGPGKVLEYYRYSDGKLKHVIPEATKYKSLVSRNSAWLSAATAPEGTGFLKVDLKRVDELETVFPDEARADLRELKGLEKYWEPAPEKGEVVDKRALEEDLGRVIAVIEALE